VASTWQFKLHDLNCWRGWRTNGEQSEQKRDLAVGQKGGRARGSEK